MALVRVGRLAAIDLDRVRAIRIESEAASVYFAGGSESITFSNADGEWSRLADALPEVGRLYRDDAQGGPDMGDLPGSGSGSAGIG